MKFNVDIISEELSKNFKIIKSFYQNKDRFIDHLLTYTGNEKIHTGYLYICQNDVIPSSSEKAHFAAVCIGVPKRGIFPHNFIMLDPDSNFYDVFNCLLKLFDKCKDWKDGLIRILLDNGAIEQMLLNTAPLINNPMYLHDENFRIIAMTDDGTNATNFPDSEWLVRGRLSPGFVHEIIQTHDYVKLFDVHGLGYWKKRNDRHLKFSYLFYNYHINGKYAGRMVIYEKNRAFTALDRALIEDLCQVTEMSIRRLSIEEINDKRELSSLLLNICSGVAVDKDTLENALSSVGCSVEDSYFCFSLGLHASDFIYKTVIPTSRSIEEHMDKCITFINGNNIGAVVKINNRDNRNELLDKQLLPILESYNYHVGVSKVFSGLYGLEIHWKQANRALEIRGMDRNTQLHMFDNLLLKYFVHRASDEFGFSLLCPQGLKRLIEYDLKNSTDFVNTLKVFLENGHAQKKSADILHVHRSTFLYRLKRITEISGYNFEEEADKLQYLFLIEMYKQGVDKDERVFGND